MQKKDDGANLKQHAHKMAHHAVMLLSVLEASRTTCGFIPLVLLVCVIIYINGPPVATGRQLRPSTENFQKSYTLTNA